MSSPAEVISDSLQIEQYLTLLGVLIESQGEIFARDDDIHTHTRALAQSYAQFYAVDLHYNLSNRDKSVDTAMLEIQNLTPAETLNAVNQALNTIKNTSQIDAETGLNLQDIFVRTWSLTFKLPNISNVVGLVIDNLAHNAQAGGGCIPGIIARLIQPYSAFIYESLKVERNNRQNLSDMDDDLSEALRLSALEAHESTEKPASPRRR